MKSVLAIIVMLFTLVDVGAAQGKYFTKSGTISFDASGPTEKIEAENTKATCVYDAATQQLEFAVLMRAFKFEKALMEEHFNENYVESDKFPKSTFKGKVSGALNTAKNGSYPVTVEGKLTIHGVTKDVKTSGTMVVSGDDIAASATFNVSLADYNIDIPSVVKGKLNDKAKITVKTNLKPMK